jgi:hypothetical protein
MAETGRRGDRLPQAGGTGMMNTEAEIEAYIDAQPGPKRDDLRALDAMIRRVSPDAKLWFLDGRDAAGKVVSNPNIGYGAQMMKVAGGKSREFYRIGLSANTAGISVYVMGLEDRQHLSRTWGERLGKATVTGYCIKFRSLADIDRGALEEVVRFGLGA